MKTRVTEVLDYLIEPELLAWMLRTSKAKREAASTEALIIGSYVDLHIQLDLKQAYPQIVAPVVEAQVQHIPEHLCQRTDNCIGAWEKFKLRRPDIVASIVRIQPELEVDGIIGHPDFECETTDRWGIIDVKTSRTVYPKNWTQTAKYTDLKARSYHTDKYMRKQRFLGVLRLDKETGEPFYTEIEDESQIAYEVRIFEAHRRLYDHNVRVREFIRQQLEREVLGV